MSMEDAIASFLNAYTQSPHLVARFLDPVPPANNPARLYAFWQATNEERVLGDVRYALQGAMPNRTPFEEVQGWVDIIGCYWRAVDRILKVEQAENQGKPTERLVVDMYDAWKDLTSNFIKHISNGNLPSWAILTLCHTADHLRKIAIKADATIAETKPVAFNAGFQDDVVNTNAKNQKLEDSVRVFNRILPLCTNDKNPDMMTSRKWGLYAIANIQFRTFFKLKAISLCKNVVKSIDAQVDLPPFHMYPAAQRVTYKYYVGVLAFLQEDYANAETHLTEAWLTCHSRSTRNMELILTYLVPCRLITQHKIPSPQLLDQYPHLRRLFGDLVIAIVKGDLSGFDKALAEGEPEFVKRRVFLTLERSRDIALRNLLRKVFLAEGYEDLKEGQTEKDRVRQSRIPISHFAAAFRIGTAGAGSGQAIEDDEVECLLANMIYKGLMKGYIARDRGIVVMNKKGAFPGTGV